MQTGSVFMTKNAVTFKVLACMSISDSLLFKMADGGDFISTFMTQKANSPPLSSGVISCAFFRSNWNETGTVKLIFDNDATLQTRTRHHGTDTVTLTSRIFRMLFSLPMKLQPANEAGKPAEIQLYRWSIFLFRLRDACADVTKALLYSFMPCQAWALRKSALVLVSLSSRACMTRHKIIFFLHSINVFKNNISGVCFFLARFPLTWFRH